MSTSSGDNAHDHVLKNATPAAAPVVEQARPVVRAWARAVDAEQLQGLVITQEQEARLAAEGRPLDV
jgi:hypothetical protein